MYKIAVMEGDGIGAKIVKVTVSVLNAIQVIFDDIKLEYDFLSIGLQAYDLLGTTLP